MSGKVYANGREVVSGGSTHGKVSGAFPDVCNSPPGPPSGPLPVPYLDSSNASGLKKGSKNVKIGGKPIGMRDQSFYKCSPLGNEAATKNFGGNLVTHAVTGKTQFGSWSHDVKIEGQGALRHRDLTTSNNGSYPGGTPPFVNLSCQQQLALDRIAQNLCPCCGSKDCPAAFEDGEEPLSMKEYYKVEPHGTKNASKRTTDFRFLREYRRKVCQCTVETRVFPEPPCDVFRRSTPAKTLKIANAWGQHRRHYVEEYQRRTGRTLQDKSYFFNLMVNSHSSDEQTELRKAGKRTKPQSGTKPKKPDPWRDLWKRYDRDADRLVRINHLVPKEAGGCPTNDGNLQPQQVLCEACQDIDQWMTDGWQG